MASELETTFVIKVRTDGTPTVTTLAAELEKLGARGQSAAAGVGPLGAALGTVGSNASRSVPQVSALASEAQRLHSAFTAAGGGVQGFVGSLSSLGGLASSVLPITAAVVGLGVAFAGMKAALGAAAEAQDSMTRLDAAVRRTGADAAEAVPKIEAAIKASPTRARTTMSLCVGRPRRSRP